MERTGVVDVEWMHTKLKKSSEKKQPRYDLTFFAFFS